MMSARRALRSAGTSSCRATTAITSLRIGVRERRVELHPEAAIDANPPLVVRPGHGKDDLPLRLTEPLDQGTIGVARMLGDHTAETSEHLLDGLMEFLLTCISVQNLGKDGLQLFRYEPRFRILQSRKSGGP